MKQKGPADPARSFGVSVGTVLIAIAAVLAWRGRVGRAEFIGALGAVLLLLGLVAPRLLDYPSAVWWRFSRALGAFNARVLLTALFAVVLTPLSLLWRLIGKDPLARRRSANGWTEYPARYRDPKHFERMY